MVDTGATAEQLEEITNTIAGVEGVEAYHDLRTRRMGQRLLVEVHVLVGSQVTVSEGHMTGDRARADLMRNHPYISEVLFHVDPEDDASHHEKTILPSREELLRRLEQRWQGLDMELPVERVNFHYL